MSQSKGTDGARLPTHANSMDCDNQATIADIVCGVDSVGVLVCVRVSCAGAGERVLYHLTYLVLQLFGSSVSALVR